MITLVGGLVIVVLVGLLVLGGASGLLRGSDDADDGDERRGFGPAMVLPAAAGAFVVLLLAVVVFGLLVGGLRGRRSPASVGDAPAAAPDEPVGVHGPPATFDARVALAQEGGGLRPKPIVGRLADGDVVEVRARGFIADAAGVMAQCPSVTATDCRNVAAISTDSGGRVRSPYRVSGAGEGEVLVVEVDFARATAGLVFGAPAPALPVVEVAESDVTVTGAEPGAALDVAWCPSAATATGECDTVAQLVVGSDGSARGALPRWFDRRPRTIAVIDGNGSVVADPVAVVRSAGTASGARGVHVNPTRLAAGLASALLLLGIAIALIRSTDWQPPAEAATPFLDRVSLEW